MTLSNTVGDNYEKITSSTYSFDQVVINDDGTFELGGNSTLTVGTDGLLEMSSGATVQIDGTQAFNVPTLTFNNDQSLGLGFSDGGRGPNALSIIVDNGQKIVFSTDKLAALVPVQLPQYTVASAPGSVSNGFLAYISNGDAGAPCLAVGSGGTWKRVALGATISAT